LLEKALAKAKGSYANLMCKCIIIQKEHQVIYFRQLLTVLHSLWPLRR